MLPLAAAATSHHTGPALLILAVIIITVCYFVACAVWPFTACRHCGGGGQSRSPTRRAYRYCRHCEGTGTQLRTGRRLYTTLTHTRHRARRDRPGPPRRTP